MVAGSEVCHSSGAFGRILSTISLVVSHLAFLFTSHTNTAKFRRIPYDGGVVGDRVHRLSGRLPRGPHAQDRRHGHLSNDECVGLYGGFRGARRGERPRGQRAGTGPGRRSQASVARRADVRWGYKRCYGTFIVSVARLLPTHLYRYVECFRMGRRRGGCRVFV